jgi:uridine kinase
MRVAIAGDSGLGKSTLSRMLAERLSALRLEADAYGMDRENRTRKGILHLEDRRSFRRNEFLEDVQRIIREETAMFARWYNHLGGQIETSLEGGAANAEIVFLDGSCLLEPAFQGVWDVAIFLDASGSLRRRLRRKADLSRGYSSEVSAANWPRYRRFYDRRIRPWIAKADLVISVHSEWRYTWPVGSLGCTC